MKTLRHLVFISICLLLVSSLAYGQTASAAKVALGSNTAKNGFKNEDEIRDKFNNWKTDKDAQDWLVAMNYNLGEIENVVAVKPHGEKADVEVRVTTKAGEKKEGISIKLVSSPTGFNQIDKRWLATYAKMWKMPAEVQAALKLFVGEVPPSKPSRETNRMYLNELDAEAQKAVIDFFTANKREIVSDLFSGDGSHAAGWVMVAMKATDKTRWVIRTDADTIDFFADGKVELTRNGNLKIGKITVQRKGGDGGRDTSKQLQFKINPALMLDAPAKPKLAGNPIVPGWYADPEARIFDGKYWVYPTYSAPYGEQTFMDAFSSADLVNWTKHSKVVDVADISWAKRALWAPSVVKKGEFYYLFFGANDIQNDKELGGIGVARSSRPEGPFKDLLGKPLIDKFHNGAQPIDQFVFQDKDGSYYIIYGGWRHCNIAKLKDDLTAIVPMPDGKMFKEITPKGFVEGAFMFLKDGKYYFMWSEGGWTGPDYAVAYAVASTPYGPFERVGKILEQDATIATGAGHHSVFQSPRSKKWYIAYHRRPLGETDRNHRVTCIDEMTFDEKGMIKPVKLTKEGVFADAIK
ncbi:MAG: family 43 glycosylhydrolase [Pyrinomonadaceae bacterium]